MSQNSDSRAVKLARAHVETWARKDFKAARNGLAADVVGTQSTTDPDTPRHDLIGAAEQVIFFRAE